MGQQEYDNFKRLIKEWLDSHPDEYADFVEEMNDKKFKGFFNIFNTAVRLVPKYKEAARKRIGDDRNLDFEELENVLLQSDLAEKIVNEFHTPNKRSIVPAMLAWLYYGRSYECMVEQGEELTKRKDIPTLYKWLVSGMVKFIIRKSIANGMRTKEGNPVTVRVPLNDKAKEILERYKEYEGKLLPFISEQKYNDAIKKIFKLAGVDRIVTILDPLTHNEIKRPIYEVASSHLARRTFIGNIYKKVKDPNLVSALSGHKEGSKAFRRYRDIDEEMKKDLVKLLD